MVLEQQTQTQQRQRRQVCQRGYLVVLSRDVRQRNSPVGKKAPIEFELWGLAQPGNVGQGHLLQPEVEQLVPRIAAPGIGEGLDAVYRIARAYFAAPALGGPVDAADPHAVLQRAHLTGVAGKAQCELDRLPETAEYLGWVVLLHFTHVAPGVTQTPVCQIGQKSARGFAKQAFGAQTQEMEGAFQLGRDHGMAFTCHLVSAVQMLAIPDRLFKNSQAIGGRQRAAQGRVGLQRTGRCQQAVDGDRCVAKGQFRNQPVADAALQSLHYL